MSAIYHNALGDLHLAFFPAVLQFIAKNEFISEISNEPIAEHRKELSHNQEHEI